MNNQGPPRLQAGTAFLKNDPNSMVNREWLAVLKYLLDNINQMGTQLHQKLFQPSQLGQSSALIFTVPNINPQTNVQLGSAALFGCVVRLTNTTGSAATATLYAVPAQNSAGAINEFFPAISIAANSYIDVNVPVMWVNDALYGFAGTGSAISIAFMDGVMYGS